MSAPTSAPDAVDHELLATEWTLDALVDGEGEAGVTQRLQQGAELAAAFAERYRGRLAELDAPQLAAAMRALGEVFDLLGRAGAYAALRFSTDTADPERGALLAAVQEKETEIQTALLFFELEWAALEESRVEELLDPANDELDFCRHHLRSARRYRHHLLSEPEEKVLSEKALTGAVAWGRLFEELISAVEVELPTAGPPNGAAPAGPALPATESPAARVDSAGATGAQGREAVALDVALSRLASPDRGVRKGAAGAITAALAPGLRTRAFIYNTLLVDKSVDDRLRRYPNWLAARNLANEVADESVQALHEAVRGRYELARRWYRLKARLLGLERLADYDRMAAVTEDEVSFPFAAGREIVLDSYTAFSPELGAVARRLFELRHIDAPVRPAKRGGAFAAAAVPSVEPHVLLN
ncbi:MAG: oligoendopeptidase, partial [Acidobacteriota bacterium]|nr:oligoendopeptidase [Acidobacteriota bacterium]